MGPLGRASIPGENLIFAIWGVPLGGQLAWVDSSKRHAQKHHIGKGKGRRQSAKAAAKARARTDSQTPENGTAARPRGATSHTCAPKTRARHRSITQRSPSEWWMGPLGTASMPAEKWILAIWGCRWLAGAQGSN